MIKRGLLLLIILTTNILAAEITVGPGQSIQSAADSASPGDMIRVQAGTYNERVDVSNSGSSGNMITFIAEGTVEMQGFYITGDYIKVEGFNIVNAPGTGVYVRADNCIVKDNIISYVENQGVLIRGNNDLVEGNDISHVIQDNDDADGIRFFGDGHIIRNNHIHDLSESEAGGGHIDCFQTFTGSWPPSKNILIEGNICSSVDHDTLNHQCLMASADPGESSHWVFRNNVCDNYGWQSLLIWNIPYVEIYNNVFLDTVQAWAIAYSGSSEHSQIYNNIFYLDEGTDPYSDTGGVDFVDYNLWTQGTLNEPNGVSNQDPLFVNPANGDYHVQDNSPACGAGKDGADIGAYPCGSSQSCSELGGSCCSSGQTCSSTFQYSTDCGSSCCVGGTCQTHQSNNCADIGGDCCQSGQTCTGSIQDADDCSSCCVNGQCETSTGQNFVPGQIIEAEDGDIVSPMTTSTGSGASGSYVKTTSDDQGSVSFTFEITEACDYVLEARVMTASMEWDSNSFFVGLDGADVVGNTDYVYDPMQSTEFYWDEVSWRGNGDEGTQQYDPKVWTLTEGLHTFTFYGREPETRLDQVRLVKQDSEPPSADTNNDSCIDMTELMVYVNLWKAGGATLDGVLDAVQQWKEGC